MNVPVLGAVLRQGLECLVSKQRVWQGSKGVRKAMVSWGQQPTNATCAWSAQ